MQASGNIKRTLLLICAFFLLGPLMAQKLIEKNVAYKEGQEIVLELPIGESIKITGWDKQEVALRASVNINGNKLNDAYALEVRNGAVLHIEASLDEKMLGNGSVGDCNGNSDTNFQRISKGDKGAVCAEITYELKVPRNARLRLETINANVEAVGLRGPTKLKSISGFIDFSWPEQQDAELQLKSITGELYTDLAFDILNKKEDAPMIGYELKGRKGKGGPLVDLETISNNIYLRNTK